MSDKTSGEDTQHDEDFWQHLNSKQDELTSDEQLILANKQLEQAESLYKIECDKVRGLREELASLREQLEIEKQSTKTFLDRSTELEYKCIEYRKQLQQKEDENRELRNKTIDECIVKAQQVIKEGHTLRNFIRLELESLKTNLSA